MGLIIARVLCRGYVCHLGTLNGEDLPYTGEDVRIKETRAEIVFIAHLRGLRLPS